MKADRYFALPALLAILFMARSFGALAGDLHGQGAKLATESSSLHIDIDGDGRPDSIQIIYEHGNFNALRVRFSSTGKTVIYKHLLHATYGQLFPGEENGTDMHNCENVSSNYLEEGKAPGTFIVGEAKGSDCAESEFGEVTVHFVGGNLFALSQHENRTQTHPGDPSPVEDKYLDFESLEETIESRDQFSQEKPNIDNQKLPKACANLPLAAFEEKGLRSDPRCVE